ncbi:MAG: dephospho-CoA kinase [Pseudomonadota bacterium]
MRSKSMIIGLTGGIASGKSAVADIFAELGIDVVDTDVIAREIVEPGEDAFEDIVEFFGIDILDDTGGLDRRKLRDRVFANPDERLKLESFTHPRIRARAIGDVMAANSDYVVLVVPLLIESSLRQAVDRILVVDVPKTLQLQRLLDRDGGNEDTARAIIKAQTDRQTRLAAADDIIVNKSSLAALRRAVVQLHQRYLAMTAGTER